MSQVIGHHDSSSAAAMSRERRLSECYQRGLQLGTRDKNYEYAHAMFAECVVQDPGNLQFVEALIQNCRSQTPRAKKSLFKSVRRSNGALQRALQARKWTEVFQLGMDRLISDPWNVATLRAIATACESLHLNDVELVYLKQALNAEPKNPEVNRHCAHSLGRMGQFDQAIACWHRLEMLRGNDDEATRMILELAQEKLKYPGGRPPVTRPLSVPTPKQEPEVHAEEVALNPQQLLERAIASDPKNAANYLNLADLLLSANRVAAAESLLNRAITICAGKHVLAEKLEHVRELRIKQQRDIAEDVMTENAASLGPIHVPWLELSLVAAGLLLAVQIVPSMRAIAWSVIDIPHWSQLGWFVFNAFLLLGLVAIHYSAELRAAFLPSRARRRRRTSA